MRTGLLSEVIADLQMIHSRFGDAPVIISVENGDDLGADSFGGISVLGINGGRMDGQDAVVLFPQRHKKRIIGQTVEQNGELIQ